MLRDVDGGSVNICALLVGMAAFAHWTIPCSTLTRRMGWVNWLGRVGILLSSSLLHLPMMIRSSKN